MRGISTCHCDTSHFYEMDRSNSRIYFISSSNLYNNWLITSHLLWNIDSVFWGSRLFSCLFWFPYIHTQSQTTCPLPLSQGRTAPLCQSQGEKNLINPTIPLCCLFEPNGNHDNTWGRREQAEGGLGSILYKQTGGPFTNNSFIQPQSCISKNENMQWK